MMVTVKPTVEKKNLNAKQIKDIIMEELGFLKEKVILD